MTNSTNTRYEVLMAYSDDVIRWDAPFTMLSVLGQGSQGDRLLIETTDTAALEEAMDADDLVISYDVAADESTDEAPDGVRVFRAEDTNQVDSHGRPAVPGAWYWEPIDYEGDLLWSSPSPTRHAAISAAAASSQVIE